MKFEEIDILIDKLSDKLKENSKFKLIALIGDLGSGKTYISKRICKNLGVKDIVKSPTYTYYISYIGDEFEIYHYDVYRISDPDEMYFLDFEENYGKDNVIYLIEWANNIEKILDEKTIYIELRHSHINCRDIEIYMKKDGEKIHVDINSYNFN